MCICEGLALLSLFALSQIYTLCTLRIEEKGFSSEFIRSLAIQMVRDNLSYLYSHQSEVVQY